MGALLAAPSLLTTEPACIWKVNYLQPATEDAKKDSLEMANIPWVADCLCLPPHAMLIASGRVTQCRISTT